MGKKLLLTLMVLTFISILTGKMSSDQDLLAAQMLSEPVVTEDPLYDPLVRQFEEFAEQGMGGSRIPGLAVAIVRGNDIIFLKGFGVREAGGYDPIDIHTVFRLASVSKGFTPVLASKLIEEQLLDFDDRIIDYLPDFRLNSASATEELTLRHVLSHTTGLPRHTYSNLLNAGYSYPDIRKRLKDVRLSHAVGTTYNYQNVAYSLSGDVIEQVTGKKYANLLVDQLFSPLGMSDASATYQGILTSNNVALPHRHYRSGVKSIKITPNWYEVGPAAGVNASISDMARWLQFLLGNRPDVLPDALLAEVFKPQVEIPLRDKVLTNWRSLIDGAHYALGWRVLDTSRGDRVVYHGGYVNSYRSEVMLLPDEKIGIVILANAPGALMSECLPAFYQMFCDFRDNNKDLLLAVAERKISRDTVPVPALPYRYPGSVGSMKDR